MGLVEKEWLDTLGTLGSADVIFTDYVQAAKQLVSHLQDEVCIVLLFAYQLKY